MQSGARSTQSCKACCDLCIHGINDVQLGELWYIMLGRLYKNWAVPGRFFQSLPVPHVIYKVTWCVRLCVTELRSVMHGRPGPARKKRGLGKNGVRENGVRENGRPDKAGRGRGAGGRAGGTHGPGPEKTGFWKTGFRRTGGHTGQGGAGGQGAGQGKAGKAGAK